jgi:hypothetical protein
VTGGGRGTVIGRTAQRHFRALAAQGATPQKNQKTERPSALKHLALPEIVLATAWLLAFAAMAVVIGFALREARAAGIGFLAAVGRLQIRTLRTGARTT